MGNKEDREKYENLHLINEDDFTTNSLLRGGHWEDMGAEFQAVARAPVVDAGLGFQQELRSENLHLTFVVPDCLKKWLSTSLTLHPYDLFPTENVHRASHCISCLPEG